ncbi:MAG: DUF1542 domain-containing protein [Clostridiales bacterium]|nr:DUF1542 domain-containing protein [Clostridiales bacterium]
MKSNFISKKMKLAIMLVLVIICIAATAALATQYAVAQIADAEQAQQQVAQSGSDITEPGEDAPVISDDKLPEGEFDGSHGVAQADAKYASSITVSNFTDFKAVFTAYEEIDDEGNYKDGVTLYGTVKLSANITFTSSVYVTADITIDLNGYMLNTGSYYLRTARSSSQRPVLTIKDSSPSRSNTFNGTSITGGAITSTSSDALYLYYGTVNMTGGSIVGSGSGTGVDVTSTCTFTMTNGKILNFARGVSASSATVTLTNVEISNCKTTSHGGGIYSSSTTLKLYSCNIHDNSGNRGGGVYTSGGSLYLYDGTTIQSNASKQQGGGVYCGSNVYAEGKITITANTTEASITKVATSNLFLLSSYTLRSVVSSTSRIGITVDGYERAFTSTGRQYNSPTGLVPDNNKVTLYSQNGELYAKHSGEVKDAASLNSAWNAGQDYIILGANIDATADLRISSSVNTGKTIVLDLNGFVLNLKGTYEFNIASGTLIIIDSNSTKSNIVNGHSFSGGIIQGGRGSHIIHLGDGGQLDMYDGNITGMESTIYGPVHINVSGATFNMYGGTIQYNVGKDGGGVEMNAGTFNYYGGTIANNTANRGGGIYCSGGTFNTYSNSITDYSISVSGNTAETGGGVYLSGGTFNLSLGSISSNKSDNGAGVYVANGTYTQSGGSIYSNVASTDGGGIYVTGGTFKITGGTLSYNRAVNGAGIYLTECDEYTMSGGTLYSNSASEQGGGVYIAKGTLKMTSGTIYNYTWYSTDGKTDYTRPSGYNSAKQGAGVYVSGDSTLQMSGGTIRGNIASEHGGGVYVNDGGTFKMTGGSITYNQAAVLGGGVYFFGTVEFDGAGTITVNNNTLTLPEDAEKDAVPTPHNVYIPSGKTIGGTVTGTASKIGITVQMSVTTTGKEFTDSGKYTKAVGYFSDNEDYCIGLKATSKNLTIAKHTAGGKFVLNEETGKHGITCPHCKKSAQEHDPKLLYALSDTDNKKHTAICVEAGCDFTLEPENHVTQTIGSATVCKKPGCNYVYVTSSGGGGGGNNYYYTIEGDTYITEDHHYSATGPVSDGTTTHTITLSCSTSGCSNKIKITMGHDWGLWTSTNAGTHSRSCVTCTGNSTYTGTCTSKLAEYQVNPSQHWKECDICNGVYSMGDHDDNGGIVFDHAAHWGVCSTCDLAGERQVHTWRLTQSGTTHTLSCTCGYSEAHKANWNYITTGSTTHKAECVEVNCTATIASQPHWWTEWEASGSMHTRHCIAPGCEQTEKHQEGFPSSGWTSYNSELHFANCSNGCGLKVFKEHDWSTWHEYGNGLNDTDTEINGSHSRECRASGCSEYQMHKLVNEYGKYQYQPLTWKNTQDWDSANGRSEGRHTGGCTFVGCTVTITEDHKWEKYWSIEDGRFNGSIERVTHVRYCTSLGCIAKQEHLERDPEAGNWTDGGDIGHYGQCTGHIGPTGECSIRVIKEHGIGNNYGIGAGFTPGTANYGWTTYDYKGMNTQYSKSELDYKIHEKFCKVCKHQEEHAGAEHRPDSWTAVGFEDVVVNNRNVKRALGHEGVCTYGDNCEVIFREYHREDLWGEWQVSIQNEHYRDCVLCGYTDVDSNHPPQQPDYWTDRNPAGHGGYCTYHSEGGTGCTLIVLTEHTYASWYEDPYTGNHARECKQCMYIEIHFPQTIGGWKSINDEQHSSACTFEGCEIVMVRNHSWNAGWYIYGDQNSRYSIHKVTCEICDESFEHDPTDPNSAYQWNDCSPIGALKHRLTCDCGIKLEEEHSGHWEDWKMDLNTNTHYRYCEDCRYMAQHNPGEPTEWYPRGNGHYGVCSAVEDCHIEVYEAHNEGSWNAWSWDGTQHIRTCQTCKATETHAPNGSWTIGSATTHVRYCSICKLTETHDIVWGDAVDYTVNAHRYTCTSCELFKDEAHRWLDTDWEKTEDPNVHIHYCQDGCGRSETHTANWTKYESIDGTDTHSKTCKCGLTHTEDHVWSTTYSVETTGEHKFEHYRQCELCLEKEYHIPAMSDNWTGYDAKEHFSLCASCDIGLKEAHTWTAWTTSDDETKHVRTCEKECGASQEHVIDWQYESKGEEGHRQYCDDCDIESTVAHDSWSAWATDAEGNHFKFCTTCDYVVSHKPVNPSQWKNSETVADKHEGVCAFDGDCDQMIYADHVIPDDVWTDCHDGINHQSVCLYCDETIVKPHRTQMTEGDNDNHHIICTVCEYDKAEAHVLATDDKGELVWGWDDENHYNTCEQCLQHVNVANHQLNGNKCTTCTYDKEYAADLARMKQLAKDEIAIKVETHRINIKYSGLSQDVINILLDAIDREVARGYAAIDAVTDITKIEGVKQECLDNLERIATSSDALIEAERQNAKDRIDETVEAANKLIDAFTGINNAIKAARKAGVKSVADNAKAALDNVNTVAEFDEIVAKAIEDIYYIACSTSEQAEAEIAKEKRVDNIRQKAEKAKAEIDALEELTPEERDTFKQIIDDLCDETIKAIRDTVPDYDEMTDEEIQAYEDLLDQLEQQGIDEIREVVKNQQKKSRAKVANTGAKAAKAAKAFAAADKAKAASNGDVQTYADDDDPFEDVLKLLAAINNARKSLNDAKEAAYKMVANLGLSAEEKAKREGDIDLAHQTAWDGMGSAESLEEVAQKLSAGRLAIYEAVGEGIDAKVEADRADALDAIAKALEEAKAAISEMSALSQEDRDALTAQVEATAKEAIAAISASMDAVEIYALKETALTSMSEVVALAQAKNDAYNDLNTHAQDRIDYVESRGNLYNSEKKDLQDAIRAELERALTAVANATSVNDVTKASVNAQRTMDEIADRLGVSGLDPVEDPTKDPKDDPKYDPEDPSEIVLQKVREKVKGELEKYAQDRIDHVTKVRNDLYNSEKDEIVSLITAELSRALAAVDLAQTEAEVYKVQGQYEARMLELSLMLGKSGGDEVLDPDDSDDPVYPGNPDDPDPSEIDMEALRSAAKKELDDYAFEMKNHVSTRKDLTDAEKETLLRNIGDELERGYAAILTATKDELDGVVKDYKQSMYDIAHTPGEKDPDKDPDEPSGVEIQEAKNKAKKDLADYAEAKKAEIDARNDLYNSEKESLKKDIEAELQRAYASVDSAETMKEIEMATANSKAKMDEIAKTPGVSGGNVVPDPTKDPKDDPNYNPDKPSDVELSRIKSDAKKELKEYAEGLKVGIDGREDLYNQEKEDLKKLIDEELLRAYDAVDLATTENEVKGAVSKYKSIMDEIASRLGESDGKPVDPDDGPRNDPNVPSEIDIEEARSAAKKELAEYAYDKKADIDNRKDLTDEEKETLKSNIDAELERAYGLINAAEDKEAIDKTVADSKARIDDYANAQGKSKGKDVFNEKAKEDAKEELGNYAESKKDEIDAREDLTNEEKDILKGAIDDELARALEAVENSTNMRELEEAVEGAKATFDDIASSKGKHPGGQPVPDPEEPYQPDPKNPTDVDLVNAKNDAKKELAGHAQGVKDAIDAREDIYNSEKEDLKALVDEELANGYAAIEEATTLDGVASAKQASMDEMDRIGKMKGVNPSDDPVDDPSGDPEDHPDGVHPNEIELEVAKSEAKKEVEDFAYEKKAEVDARNDLTNAEKDILKKAIDEATKEALEEIEKAESMTEIEKAVDEAKSKLDEISKTLGESKGEPVPDPDAPHVPNPNDPSGVDLVEEQSKAKQALEEHAAAKKAAIDARDDLYNKEKEDLKNLIDQELANGYNAIDSAKTFDDIASAKQASMDEMDRIADLEGVSKGEKVEHPEDDPANHPTDDPNPSEAELEAAKGAAKKELDNFAYEKKQEVDDRKDLTAEEKEDLKSRIDQKAADAKSEIESATDLSTIDETVSKAKKEMQDISEELGASQGGEVITPPEKPEDPSEVELAKARNDAKNDVLAAADKAKETIKNRTDLTNAEKEILTKAIDDELARAYDAIDNATTVEDIQKAADKAKAKMEEIAGTEGKYPEGPFDPDEPHVPSNPPTGVDIVDAQNTAKKELEKHAEGMKTYIDERKDLYNKEKEDLKKSIDDELERGYGAIDRATNPDDIIAARDASKAKMNDIADTLGVSGGKEVDPEGDPEKDPNYDPEKPSDIELKAAKNAAKGELEEFAYEKKDEIDKREDLSNKEKEVLKKAIDDELDRAYDEIDNATTVREIEKAVTAAKENITDIANAQGETKGEPADPDAPYNPDPTDPSDPSDVQIVDKKNDAKKQLAQHAADKKTHINGRLDLYNSEKATLCDLIDDALARGYAAIDAAATIDQINSAVTESKAEMDKISTTLGVSKGSTVIHDDQDPSTDPKYDPDHPSDVELLAERNAAKKELEEYAYDTKKAIDERNDLTNEEKETLKSAVNDELARAYNTIDAATTDKEIEIAVSNAKDNMDAIAKAQGQSKGQYVPVPEDPEDPKNPGAGSEEPSEVDLVEAKNAAKKELKEFADGLKAAIDARDDLYTSEKEELKQLIDNELARAYEAVENATSEEEIAKAVDNYKDTMEAISKKLGRSNGKEVTDPDNTLSPEYPPREPSNPSEIDFEKERNAAKKELESYAYDKKAEIDERVDLTNAEKEILKDSIDAELERAYNAINDAETQEEIKSAVSKAKSNMDDIASSEGKYPGGQPVPNPDEPFVPDPNNPTEVELQQAKSNAKDELKDYADAKKDYLDNRTDLTDAEKDELRDAIDDELQRAYEAIEDASTLKDIEKAVSKAEASMDEIATAEGKSKGEDVFNEKAKELAKEEVAEYAEAKKAEIDERTDLTDAEKQILKDAIDAEVERANEAIDRTTNLREIEEAVENAKSKMDNIAESEGESKGQPVDPSKPYDPDPEQPTDVDLVKAKDEAKDAAKQKAEQVKKEIDKRDDLYDSEKEDLKRLVDEALEAGYDAIDEATTPEEVKKAEEDLEAELERIGKLKGVNPGDDPVDDPTKDPETDPDNPSDIELEIAKSDAKKDVKDYAHDKKAEIDERRDLTDEEKQTLKDAIDAEVERALDAVDAAETMTEVNKARDESKSIIDDIASSKGASKGDDVANEKVKEDAKNELGDYAEAKKAEIERRKDLTNEEKKVLEDAIDEELQRALDAIENSTNMRELEEAVENAKSNIDDIAKSQGASKGENVTDPDAPRNPDPNNPTDVDIVEQKSQAKKDLEAKAEKIKEAIDKRDDLYDSEKEDLKKLVDEALAEGYEEIEKATTPEEIKQAKEDAEAELERIGSLNGVTDGEPLGDKDPSDDPTKDPDKDPETPSEIEFETAKSEAKKDVEDFGYEKKKEIDKRTDLTNEEKEILKDAIDDEVERALEAIESAESQTEIDRVVDAAKGKIDEISKAQGESKGDDVTDPDAPRNPDPNNPSDVDLVEKKNDAKKDLEAKAEEIKEAIDKRDDLYDSEKEDLKKLVDEALAESYDEIDKATTPEEIEQAKQDAEAELERIGSLNGVTDGEPLGDKDPSGDPSKDPDKDPETPSDIELETAKSEAKKDLDNFAYEKKQEVDERTDLTEEEKQEFKDRIDQTLAEAKDAINGETDIDKIDDIVNGAKGSMQDIAEEKGASGGQDVPQPEQPEDPSDVDLVAKKNNAKKELAEYSEQMLDKLEERNDLYDSEKAALRDLIEKELANGYAAIEAATTSEGIDEALEASKKEMKRLAAEVKGVSDGQPVPDSSKNPDDYPGGVHPSEVELETAKGEAKSELDNFAYEKKQEVDQRDDLTDEEKQDRKDRIDEELKKAKDAIGQETDIDNIDDIVKNAKDTMQDISEELGESGGEPIPQPEEPEEDDPTEVELIKAKKQAKQELEEYAEGRKSIIDGRDDLYDSEKEALKKLIDEELARACEAVNAAETIKEVGKVQGKYEANMDAIASRLGVSQGEHVDDPTKDPSEDPKHDPEDPSEVELEKAKSEAKKELEDFVYDKKQEVDARKDLTDAEKEILKDNIDQELERYYDVINNADSEEEIEQALEDAKKSIDDMSKAKGASKGSEDIDPSAPYVPDPEDPSDIDIIEARNEAKKELEKQAEKIKNNIDKRDDLYDSEKEDLKKLVDNALADGYKAINEATDPEGIQKAYDDCVAEMERLSELDGVSKGGKVTDPTGDPEDDSRFDPKHPSEIELEKAAQKAAQELEDFADAKKDEILNNSAFSEEEKKDLLDRIDEELEKALDKIKNADNFEDIDQAVEDCENAIENVVKDYTKDREQKNKAKKELQDKASQVEKDIQLRDDLTPEEKQELIDRIEEELKKAQDAVENASTPEDIEKALQEGLTNIENAELNDAKEKAREEVTQKGEDAKKELQDRIDDLLDELKDIQDQLKNGNLTDEEKKELETREKEVKAEVWDLESALDEIDEKVQQGLQDIENATTPDEVKDIVDSVEKDIGKIVDEYFDELREEKDNAQKELVEKAKEERQKVEDKVASGDLTREEADEIIDRINDELQKAKDAVDKAVNSEQVEKAKEEGMKNIEDAELNTAKDRAKKDLNDKAQEAKDVIDSNPNLSDKEKQEAKDAIDDALIEAKDAVDNAKNLDEIEDAVKKGEADIVEVVDKAEDSALENAKQDALKKLEDEYNKAKDEIDNNPKLSDEEKQELLDKLEKEYEDAKKKIEDALTPGDVKDAVKSGTSGMGKVAEEAKNLHPDGPKDPTDPSDPTDPTNPGAYELDLGIAVVSLSAQAIVLLAALFIIRRKTKV